MPLSKLGMFCGIILMHIKTCHVRGHLNNHPSSEEDSVQELFHFYSGCAALQRTCHTFKCAEITFQWFPKSY